MLECSTKIRSTCYRQHPLSSFQPFCSVLFNRGIGYCINLFDLYLYVLQLVKLLEMREANHIEFCRMKNVLDEILHMHKNCELSNILKLLMDPSSVATGLKIDYETFVSISSNSLRSIYLAWHRLSY